MFIPEGLIGSKSVLIQVVTWRLTGDKLLSEAIMTLFNSGDEIMPLVSQTSLLFRCTDKKTSEITTLRHWGQNKMANI